MNESISTDWWKAVNSEFLYEHELANKSQYIYSYSSCYEQTNHTEIECPQQYPLNNSSIDNMCYMNSNYCYPEMQSYAPCEGPRPWNFAYCYGFYGEPPCQFANMVDMEDFM